MQEIQVKHCSAITVINMNVKAEHNSRGINLFINTKKFKVLQGRQPRVALVVTLIPLQ